MNFGVKILTEGENPSTSSLWKRIRRVISIDFGTCNMYFIYIFLGYIHISSVIWSLPGVLVFCCVTIKEAEPKTEYIWSEPRLFRRTFTVTRVFFRRSFTEKRDRFLDHLFVGSISLLKMYYWWDEVRLRFFV